MNILENAKCFRNISIVRISSEQLDEYSKALYKMCMLWPHTSTAQKIREDLDVPEFAAIHRDGKIIPSLTLKYKSVKWLPVHISGNDNFKLLGIHFISKS